MTIRAYKTVAGEGNCEVVIQKSRFIGHCYPFERQEDAEAKLAELRKTYWDASHNCYAYCIGQKGDIARFSDDGEPGGTAGRPIMEVIKAQDLVNILLVVTRYFGGTLLGVGGLVRAYSRTASDAVQAAGAIVMLPTDHYLLNLSYPQWNRLQQPLEKAGYRLDDVVYGENVELHLAVKQEDAAEFLHFISERGEGQIAPEWAGTDHFAWSL